MVSKRRSAYPSGFRRQMVELVRSGRNPEESYDGKTPALGDGQARALLGGALFRPVKNNTGGTVEGAITADGIYKMVKHYAKRVGVNIEGFGAHSLRATAATNALDHEADIAKVQEWLGHANIAATRIPDQSDH
jgi:integrase/recombinase XerD